MAVRSKIEFGFGHFAEFEFAREQGAAEFADADLASTGIATASFVGRTVSIASLASAGAGSAAFNSAQIQVVRLESAGVGSVVFNTITGNGFAMAGSTTLQLFADAVANAGFVVSAGATSFIEGRGLAHARMDVAAAAAVNWANQTYFDGVMASSGAAAAAFHGQNIVDGVLVVSGSSALFLDMELQYPVGTVHTEINFAGSSSTLFATTASAITTLLASGHGEFTIGSAIVLEGVLQSDSLAVVQLFPGSQVSSNMPPAFDVIIRPYENRTVEWKK